MSVVHRHQVDAQAPSIDIKTDTPFAKTQVVDGTSCFERVKAQFVVAEDLNTHEDELGLKEVETNLLDFRPQDHKTVFRLDKQEVRVKFDGIRETRLPYVFKIVFNQSALTFNIRDLSPTSRLLSITDRQTLFLKNYSDLADNLNLKSEDFITKGDVVVKGTGELTIRSVKHTNPRSQSDEEKALKVVSETGIVEESEGSVFETKPETLRFSVRAFFENFVDKLNTFLISKKNFTTMFGFHLH